LRIFSPKFYHKEQKNSRGAELFSKIVNIPPFFGKNNVETSVYKGDFYAKI